jgi:DNA polymerase-3 subunit epsilon
VRHRTNGPSLEAVEIKRLWPKYNRSLKRFEHTFGLYTFEDQRGYLRLAVDKHRKYTDSVHSCRSLLEGYSLLNQLIEEFGLCPKLCFVQKNNDACTGTNLRNAPVQAWKMQIAIIKR